MEIDDIISDLLSDRSEIASSVIDRNVDMDEINLPKIEILPYKEPIKETTHTPIKADIAIKKKNIVNDKIVISQSLITKMFYKGNLKQYCKHYIKRIFIDKDIITITSSAMKYGLYGEQLMIGASANDNNEILLDRNRKKCTNKDYYNIDETCQGCPFYNNCLKTTFQEKIELQTEIFKQECNNMGIDIAPLVNTQMSIYKHFPNEPNFIINGTFDVFPVFAYINDEIKLSLFDIKFTHSINSNFSFHNWNNPDKIDFIQLHLYHYLLKDIDYAINTHLTEAQILLLKFAYHYIQNNLLYLFYWVFEYGTNITELSNKIITLEEHNASYSTLVEMETHEIIRATINEIKNNTAMELWDERTACFLCKNCPMKFNCVIFEEN